MTAVKAVSTLAESLGVEAELRMLRELIAEWTEKASPEVREMLRGNCACTRCDRRRLDLTSLRSIGRFIISL